MSEVGNIKSICAHVILTYLRSNLWYGKFYQLLISIRNSLHILKCFTRRNSGRFSLAGLMAYLEMGYFLSCDYWLNWWLVEDRVHYTYKFLSFRVPLQLTKSKGTSPISGTNIRSSVVETLTVWISQLMCLLEGLLSKQKCCRIIGVFTVYSNLS